MTGMNTTTTNKVLIIDDDRLTLSMLTNFMKKNALDVSNYTNPKEALNDLHVIDPDIIITDYHMDSINGIELCKILRKQDKWYYIIFITSDDDLDLLSTAFDAGANDFIKKPINAFELSARLLNAKHIVNLIKHHKEQHSNILEYTHSLELQTKELHNLTMVDPLTGLYNRRYAEIILDRDWKDFVRSSSSFSIISIDIDKFKGVNDDYGHDVGDLVLIHIATIMNKTLRQNDVLCRMGGEEFIVICNDNNVENLSEKLRHTIETVQPFHLNLSRQITISVGGATVSSTDCAWKDTYKHSDIALYKAKHNGRNRVEIYE